MFLLTLLSDIYGDLTQGRYSKEVATFRTTKQKMLLSLIKEGDMKTRRGWEVYLGTGYSDWSALRFGYFTAVKTARFHVLEGCMGPRCGVQVMV